MFPGYIPSNQAFAIMHNSRSNAVEKPFSGADVELLLRQDNDRATPTCRFRVSDNALLTRVTEC